MQFAWEVLTDAGVPDGAPRTPPRAPLDAGLVPQALSAISERADELAPHELECLAAWLSAFQHHWPDRFGSILGAVGARAHALVSPYDVDPNRYLKLRRIAVENLAGRL
jgi:hypothetical protein